MEKTEELKQLPVFCGVLAASGAATICQFVMGRWHEDAKDLHNLNGLLSKWVMEGSAIGLVEPALIMRVMTMGFENGKQVAQAQHQMMSDPYWPLSRGKSAVFDLKHFVTCKFLDPEDPREAQNILTYENSILQQFAAKSGLTLHKSSSIR